MANIRENKKNGKIISFRFIVCLERDVRGKQIRKYTTWTAPADLTPAKARKAAERAADAWEEEVKAEYQKQKKLGSAYRLPPDKRRDDFVSFVNDTWFVLQIRGENDKPNTIAFYKNMTRMIGGIAAVHCIVSGNEFVTVRTALVVAVKAILTERLILTACIIVPPDTISAAGTKNSFGFQTVRTEQLAVEWVELVLGKFFSAVGANEFWQREDFAVFFNLLI